MARAKPATLPPDEHTEPLERVDFILTADIHLREDQPICRIDDFLPVQVRKIAWLRDLQIKHGVPIIDAGDIFSKSRPSPTLLKWAIERLPAELCSVPGNHDLPEHNLENLDKSGFGVLVAAKAVKDITGGHKFPLYKWTDASVIGVPWGVEYDGSYADIVVRHVMTFVGDKPWPGCRDINAEELLHQTNCQLLLTGHNHVPFVIEDGNKLLVNPGSLFRTTAAQANHRPRVYLYDAYNNKVQAVYVPIEEGVVSRDHIERTEGKEERLSTFISRLAEDVELGLNFEANLNKHMDENRTRRAVRQLIEKALEEDV